jgi:hypothetical protein
VHDRDVSVTAGVERDALQLRETFLHCRLLASSHASFCSLPNVRRRERLGRCPTELFHAMRSLLLRSRACLPQHAARDLDAPARSPVRLGELTSAARRPNASVSRSSSSPGGSGKPSKETHCPLKWLTTTSSPPAPSARRGCSRTPAAPFAGVGEAFSTRSRSCLRPGRFTEKDGGLAA